MKRTLNTVWSIGQHHPRVPLQVEPELLEMDLGTFDGMEAGRWADLSPEFLAARKALVASAGLCRVSRR